ncbi:MAG: M42 family metallopeptidase [candidate division WOR-3 bacterium]|uniref:M42 family peptidase n=1 Tax=candidate division WOR-3 bacterium TaxID=2052148 RepID=A0A7C4VZJ6_UNCW3
MIKREELFKSLTEAFGPSGFEKEVSEILKTYFSYVGEIVYDRLGSIICKREKKGLKIMFAAHMDEVGFLVSKITKEGYVQFLPIGGWYSQVLLGSPVKIRTYKGDFLGVIGAKPPHELPEEERNKVIPIEKMYIDFGTFDGFDISKEFGIRIGDPIIPFFNYQKLPNNLHLGKAWDDRFGCAILCELGYALKEIDHPNSIYLVGTCQEEVGLRGARTAAEFIKPDIAFAIDVSIARDYPGYSLKETPERLKNGCAIITYDVTMIPNIKLRDFVIEIAEKYSIKYHLTTIRGGYDTGAIHLKGIGVPSLAIGIPTRYIHSHCGIIAEEDYIACLNLLIKICENLEDFSF